MGEGFVAAGPVSYPTIPPVSIALHILGSLKSPLERAGGEGRDSSGIVANSFEFKKLAFVRLPARSACAEITSLGQFILSVASIWHLHHFVTQCSCPVAVFVVELCPRRTCGPACDDATAVGCNKKDWLCCSTMCTTSVAMRVGFYVGLLREAVNREWRRHPINV